LRKLRYLLPVLCLFGIELGCGDYYRPVANPIIGQGGTPQTTHYAFVLNNNPIGASSTLQVDVSGDTNLQVQPTGAGAVAESFLANNNGALLTANSLADSVSEFTTIISFSPVTTINLPVGSRPIRLTSTSPGFMYVLNSSGNTNCPNTGSVSVINTSVLTVIDTVCVGPNPLAFAQLPNGTKIYIANQGNNSVSVFDPGSGQITSTITQSMGLGLNPVFVIANPDSNYVFVVNQGDGTNPGSLSIITSSNDQVVTNVPLGVGPTFAYVDNHLLRLYVTNSGSNSVSVFDLATINTNNNPVLPTLATVNVGSGPVGVTALPDGTRFYTANSMSNDVTVVSATSFAVLKTIPVGQTPVWITSEPTSTKVYTANKNSGNISIIQTVNDSLVSNMAVPQQDPNCSSSCALQQPTMILTF
jgi:YVTN family beta-propeller protein